MVVAERKQESEARGLEISVWLRPSNVGLPHTRWLGAGRSDLSCHWRTGPVLSIFNSVNATL